MKVVQINSTCGTGSIGKICVSISQLLTRNNIENYVLYTQGNSNYPLGIKYSNETYKKIQALKSRVFGNNGLNSYFATKNLIKHLEIINPDIIHIHNIHSHDCNLKILFNYLRSKQKKVYWTFHDCWAFTANCPYFDLVKCDQWKKECKKCPQIKKTSWFFDRSKALYRIKREAFSDINLTIITPSRWLKSLVQESFLKNYPVEVINNGIDLNLFKPTESDFRKKYTCEDKKIVLGVALGWEKRKGIDVFIELSNTLDSNIYQIVLVGTNDEVDKLLPKNIISIHRTQNQIELSEIYTEADLFVIPTREDNFPTVNIESLACGTPVLTFNTGGSPEIIDETCGSVVKCDDTESLEKEIIRICNEHPYSSDSCIKRAEKFNMWDRFNDYIVLYNQNNC